ncbi:MFS transporter [Streptomyces brasiliensis]|uniref:MFS transporter n=1 Tax=Streptomyces brasiliensis TaxID=1954 RepID=A0A917UIN1_9ACTN|nr:MFS transporter [Streptomyces brasiliensis]GGJ60420.1 MFS transporter [Streptomyces brasiliensis]
MHNRYTQLVLIALLQVLSMAMWFSASAVVPALRTAWHIDDSHTVWLTSSVQVGFVLGAILSAVLNLPDRFAPHRLAAASALGAAAATLALPAFAHGLPTAVACRLLVGVCLAGVYPVGMKLMASWFPSTDRGLALGVLVASLTLGSALPQLINGLPGLPWQAVLTTAGTLGIIAAVLAALLVRPGPHLSAGTRPRPRYAIEMFRHRGPLLANLGYFGHMWELYAWWTWLPTFMLASATHGAAQAPSRLALGLGAFTAIGVAGAVGCLIGGWAADRFGRPQAAGTALAISSLCCAASPLIFQASWPLLLAVLSLWGAAAVADSAVFSTVLSEVADQRYTGTALTVQTAVGYLLTVVSINGISALADSIGWQYVFLLLAPGPALGALAMRALARRTPHTSAAQSVVGDFSSPT